MVVMPHRASFSVLAAAAEAPQQIALIEGERSWSYAALADEVAARAETLVPSPGAVRVQADTSARAALELYALMEVGQTALLLHPRLTPAELQLLARGSAPAAHPGILAVAYTSGTSGQPKGVMLSRRAFAASARATAEVLGWRGDDRWLACLPFAHVGGLSILTRCLLARSAAVLVARFDPEAVANAIARHQVTLLSLVPAMLDRMLEELPRWRMPECVRAVLLGGAAASPDLLARARARGVPVMTTYGMTETCSHLALDGKLLPGVEVRIDQDRVLVRGPMLMDGYAPPHDRPSPIDEEGWLATGDRGRLHSSGELEIWGRADDVIISGGENVDPIEVERALEGMEGIRAACVFPVDDARWGQVVAAAVVSHHADLHRLAAGLRQRLAPHKRPRRIALLESLPLSAAGKLDRAAARAVARAHLVPLAYR